MGETPAQANGFRWPRTGLPTTVLVAAVVVAVVAVSGLIVLLYRETRGPGEILRRFATEVDEHDCGGSYELLDESVRVRIPEDSWCTDFLPSVDSQIDADFSLERAVLEGDDAEVHISGVPTEVWRLRRHGERSWRVLFPEDGFSFVEEL